MKDGPLIGIVLLVGAVWLAYDIFVPSPTALPASTPLSYEIVDTDEERARGLSGRDDIPADYGMLFVFPSEGIYGFWMKDMLAPIDIVWLSREGVIVGIEANVSPDTYPTEFFPPTPILYALETAAGEASRKGWKVGDRLPLPI